MRPNHESKNTDAQSTQALTTTICASRTSRRRVTLSLMISSG